MCSAIILISFGIGIYFYPQMPEMVASHWNIVGEADGYLPKFWALFIVPLISLGLFALFVVIPRIDPLKNNIQKFRRYYDAFVVLFLCFLSYLGFLVIFWNSGMSFNMIQALTPAFGILFYYLGILTENAKRNWSVGIRTPWTLSNDDVWDKTHKLGGKLFKACGVLAAVGGFIFDKFAIFFILAPILVVTVYVTVFSYFEYKKQFSQVS